MAGPDESEHGTLMTSPTLVGCWAKLRRADLHLQELNEEIGDYVAEDHSRKVSTYDEAKQLSELRIEVGEPPNDLLWSVILGDFLHNVRSALDHLVWQLVLLAGKQQPGRQHQFPIAMTKESYERPDGLRDRCLAGVAEEHRAIIDRVQPFRLGDDVSDHSLAHLRRLSNADKHRILPVTMFMTQAPEEDDFVLYDADDDCEIEIELPVGRLAVSETLAIVRVKGAKSANAVTLAGQLRIEFGFLDADGHSLTVSSFRALWERVGSLIFEFKDAFGAAGEIVPLL